MNLSEFTQGRDNNFNLIRIIAAYTVLVVHCFPLALGRGAEDPLSRALGVSMSGVAVDIFFLASGFLVTASLLARQSTIDFIWARVLRVFPALFVMLVITVGGLGLFFSTLSPAAFFSDPATHKYFWKCLTLLNGVKYELPGVFTDNPYDNAVNGSLWTMRFELRLYVILALVWVFLRLLPGYRVKALKITVLAGAIGSCALLLCGRFGLLAYDHVFLKLFFMFFTGAAFFILRARISLSRKLFYPALATLLLSALHPAAFFLAYHGLLAYILFFLAYIPAGPIRAYNRVGDYSYGVYIYAFPVQQAVAALIPGVTVLNMLLISSLLSFMFAALSWHLLEQHALNLKAVCVSRTQGLLGWARASK